MEPLVILPSPWNEMFLATVGSSKFVMLKKSEFVFVGREERVMTSERKTRIFLEGLMMFEEEQEFDMVVWFLFCTNEKT
jgi:hypothetical protein